MIRLLILAVFLYGCWYFWRQRRDKNQRALDAQRRRGAFGAGRQPEEADFREMGKD